MINKTEEEILNQDFKIFHAEDVSFGVAQISAMGRTELDKVQERIEPKLEQMMGEKQIQMIFVMLTDILNESTYLIYRGADASQLVAAAYNCEPSDQGIMRGKCGIQKETADSCADQHPCRAQNVTGRQINCAVLWENSQNVAVCPGKGGIIVKTTGITCGGDGFPWAI